MLRRTGEIGILVLGSTRSGNSFQLPRVPFIIFFSDRHATLRLLNDVNSYDDFYLCMILYIALAIERL